MSAIQHRILGKVNGTWIVYPIGFTDLKTAEETLNHFRAVSGHWEDLKLVNGSLRRAEFVTRVWTKEERK